MPALTLAEAQSYFLSESSQLLKQVGYLRGATLGYQLPSQIGDARSGQIVR
jgi:L-threonylcarbamoyladenylate synthase